jgi:hypothetical protein
MFTVRGLSLQSLCIVSILRQIEGGNQDLLSQIMSDPYTNALLQRSMEGLGLDFEGRQYGLCVVICYKNSETEGEWISYPRLELRDLHDPILIPRPFQFENKGYTAYSIDNKPFLSL